jgi:hypothetical protein
LTSSHVCCQFTIQSTTQPPIGNKMENECVCGVKVKTDMSLQLTKSKHLMDIVRHENESMKLHLQTLENKLICLITHEMLSKPVMTGNGHTYERIAIEKWFETKCTSPQTNVILVNKTLHTN